MSSPELLAGLKACLGEVQPTPAERAALSAQLGSLGDLPELADAASKLAGEKALIAGTSAESVRENSD